MMYTLLWNKTTHLALLLAFFLTTLVVVLDTFSLQTETVICTKRRI